MPKSPTISIRIPVAEYMEAQAIAEAQQCSVGQVVVAAAIHSIRQLSADDE